MLEYRRSLDYTLALQAWVLRNEPFPSFPLVLFLYFFFLLHLGRPSLASMRVAVTVARNTVATALTRNLVGQFIRTI